MLEYAAMVLGGLSPLSSLSVLLKLVWAVAQLILVPLKAMIGGVVLVLGTAMGAGLLPAVIAISLLLSAAAVVGGILIIRALASR
jgi:hypothetical protein